MADININSVFAAIPGGHVSLIKNKGIIAVSNADREIRQADVERVLQATKVMAVPPGKEIMDILPIQYVVDGYDMIKDPVGMVGVRLEVEANIALGTTTSIQNLIKCIERAGLNISAVILEPLASASVVLSDDEKELGVALIDVGAGVTDISIFIDDNLAYTAMIPVGGGHITNDLSIGFRLPFSEAENIKKKYGQAMVSWIEDDSDIPINKMGDGVPANISQKEIAYIVEARVQEMFNLIKHELERSGYADKIPAGIVLTGGGLSLLKGAKELGRQILDMPIRIGAPDFIGVSSPTFSVGVGLIKYASNNKKYVSKAGGATVRRHEQRLDMSSVWGKQRRGIYIYQHR
ncbi:cell division protein FtsA [Mahella sp.]|uniref:cell division protein FtsA n=1 Tax=Mahella sp. TaxID=2798721 RepID=UPI0025BDEC98|nr:cell division protein FtsA [Mahella sp.]MBZ4666757.1 cell division protein FtsA [Mahella sp.]